MKYLHLLPKCCPLTWWVGLCALMSLEAITVWTLVARQVLGERPHNLQCLAPQGEGGSCSSCAEKKSPMVPNPDPNNTETIQRMTCHCFLQPIRRPYKQLLHNCRGLDDGICTIPLKNISLLNPEKLFQDTVGPWYNEGPREWQNLFVIMRFHYIVYPGFFSILYFTITWVKKIIHYNEDSVVIHLIYNLHSMSKICMPHWLTLVTWFTIT